MQEFGLFEAIYSQRSFTRYKSDPVPGGHRAYYRCRNQGPQRWQQAIMGVYRYHRPRDHRAGRRSVSRRMARGTRRRASAR